MTCTLQKDLIVRNYKYKHQSTIRYHSNNVSKKLKIDHKIQNIIQTEKIFIGRWVKSIIRTKFYEDILYLILQRELKWEFSKEIKIIIIHIFFSATRINHSR